MFADTPAARAKGFAGQALTGDRQGFFQDIIKGGKGVMTNALEKTNSRRRSQHLLNRALQVGRGGSYVLRHKIPVALDLDLVRKAVQQQFRLRFNWWAKRFLTE